MGWCQRELKKSHTPTWLLSQPHFPSFFLLLLHNTIISFVKNPTPKISSLFERHTYYLQSEIIMPHPHMAWDRGSLVPYVVLLLWTSRAPFLNPLLFICLFTYILLFTSTSSLACIGDWCRRILLCNNIDTSCYRYSTWTLPCSSTWVPLLLKLHLVLGYIQPLFSNPFKVL